MPYKRLRITSNLVVSSVGRRELMARAGDRAGPALCRMAGLYRKTMIGSTRVVAVVGSFGKTATTRAVSSVLDVPLKYAGLNSIAWVALALLRIRPGRSHAVIEVGINGPGQMRQRARTVRPDIAVVTCIGSEHNRSLTSLEMARHEKAEMVRALPASGLAVLNGDDGHVMWMASETRARRVTFGFGEANDVRATDMALEWPNGTRFTVHTPKETREIRIRLFGRPGVYSALAAVAVGMMEGIPMTEIVSRLEKVEPTPGRLQPEHLENGAIVLRDDFKGGEESIDAALDVMAQIPARRRIVVLGEVEEPNHPQRAIYRRQGERVGQIAAHAVFVNPGSTFSSSKSGALKGGLSAPQIMRQTTIRGTVEVLSDLQAGDVVLVKGRHTQRLQRIVLALMGHDVRCELRYCNARLTHCGICPMLEHDWEGVWATT